MAMIKEKQRDKCGSVDKKGKNNSSGSTVVGNNDGSLKSDVLENDNDIREESFRIADDIMDKVTSNSPTAVACSFADPKNFVAMDMCPVDAKLDGNTFNSNLSAACKSQVKTEDIISADADFSPDFMLDGPLPSCKPHKTEDIMNSDSVFPSDSCDSMLSSVPMNVGSSEPMVDGLRLTGNVISKQPSTMDAQYMQQQSQVFVFSTELANHAAESVMRGEFSHITEFHRAQNRTKKFLEKHSLKANQFIRQNSPQWMNNIGPMKQKPMVGANRCNMARGGFRSPMMGPNMMNHGGPPAGMNMPPRLPMWNQQGNMNPMNVNNAAASQHGAHMMSPMCNNNVMPGATGPGGGPMPPQMNAVLPGQMGPNSGAMMRGGMPPMKCSSQQPPSMDMMSDSNTSNQLLANNVLPNLANFTDDQLPLSPQTSLIGIKVPDENLTLEQKLHRKEQLAKISKLSEILLPESHSQGPTGSGAQPTPHHAMPPDMQPSVHNQLSVDDISSVLGGGGAPPGPGPGGVPTTSASSSGPASNDGDMSGMQKTGANSSAAAEWQKMQPFFDDRKRKSPGDMGRCAASAGPRSQGPPPPYHQTTRSASVPIAIPSPNPNSPGNATSNLSLPSPRTCSGMNSPASKQGPGPSPTTQHNTSIESPGHRGMNISNPGTPVSSTMHLSPNSKQKEAKMCGGPLSNEFSPANSGQQSPDGIFCRSLQTLAQQQQQKQQPQLPHNQQMQQQQQGNMHCKEPNLMPVPSPQTISYINVFEGQELTIQKQPNTSLKDTTSIVSPSLSTAGLETMMPTVTSNDGCTKVSVSAPNTPLTPTSLDLGGGRYPGTPADFSELSPGGADTKSMPQMHRGNANNTSQQMKNDLRFACSSPQMSDQQRYQQGFMGPGGNVPGGGAKSGGNFMDVTSPDKMCAMGNDGGKEPCPGNFPRIGSDNVPLNPAMNPTSKPSQFDPISSLAQMSQSLTNNVPGSPGQPTGPGGMMHGGMMPYQGPGHMSNNMHMMQMNDMGMCGNPGGEPTMQDNSRMVYNPQMVPGMNPMAMGNNVGGGNRMMPCPGGPNDNVAPPPGAKPPPGMMPNYPPMMGGNSPRMMGRPPGPGPLPNSYNGANIQVKPNAPNTIQYLPNRPQSSAVGPRGPPSLEFLQRFSNPMQNMENKMPPGHNMNYFPNNYPGPGPGNNMNDMMGNMNCSPMGPGNAMIRGPMRPNNPANMMRMGNMGMPPYGNEQMYPPPGPPNPNMPNNNCHMFMPNSANKMQSMSMPGGVAPDATQPLPPSIGQSNNFKNSPFIGPTTADPNYAQQFHNFQQQLYATTTRSQMNNQSMAGTNQQYFVPK